MSASTIGLIGIFGLLGLIFLRVPVAIALGMVGFFGYAAIDGWKKAGLLLGSIPFDISTAYSLSVLPLFVLMGEIASAAGMSGRLFAAAKSAAGRMRGSLALATIGASAGFGAVCGSSIATAATMTRIAIPEMRKAGYDDELSAGAVAAGGTIGILIPPSLIFVIYALIAQESVAKLFAAGLVPGILLTMLYGVIALVQIRMKPSLVPAGDTAEGGERKARLLGIWEFFLLFGVSVGGIYAGLFTPTEAAAVGAVTAVGIGMTTGNLGWEALRGSFAKTIQTTCMLFMIIICANMFAAFVVQTHLPEFLLSIVKGRDIPPTLLMILLIVFYIVMGCFLEGLGMILITVPVFLPLVVQYGFDPLFFGVIVVIVVELGLIHPPVGMNLFVIQAQVPDISIVKIYKGVFPFLAAPLVLLAILLIFPDIALWLPNLLYGR